MKYVEGLRGCRSLNGKGRWLPDSKPYLLWTECLAESRFYVFRLRRGRCLVQHRRLWYDTQAATWTAHAANWQRARPVFAFIRSIGRPAGQVRDFLFTAIEHTRTRSARSAGRCCRHQQDDRKEYGKQFVHAVFADTNENRIFRIVSYMFPL